MQVGICAGVRGHASICAFCSTSAAAVPAVVVGPVVVGTGPITICAVLLGLPSATGVEGLGLGTEATQAVVGAPKFAYVNVFAPGVTTVVITGTGVPVTTVVTGVGVTVGDPATVALDDCTPFTTLVVCVYGVVAPSL